MNVPAPGSPESEWLQRTLNAVEGYAELELLDLAWEELDSLPPAAVALPEVVEVRLSLYIRENRWQEVLEAGLPLCRAGAEPTGLYIHSAYALHELGRTTEARELLLSGPPALRKLPVFHYNMACYLAVSGLLQEAEVALRSAFRMDEKLRDYARTDPDLKEFHGIL
jgi:hypothetical protein